MFKLCAELMYFVYSAAHVGTFLAPLYVIRLVKVRPHLPNQTQRNEIRSQTANGTTNKIERVGLNCSSCS